VIGSAVLREQIARCRGDWQGRKRLQPGWPRTALRRWPAASLHRKHGSRGFLTSMPWFTWPAISNPTWARSNSTCSTRCCPRLEGNRAGCASSIPAAAGCSVGHIARAFAGRYGRPQQPAIVSPDTIATELGEWATGYALDQRLSGAKARRDLGWRPKHSTPRPRSLHSLEKQKARTSRRAFIRLSARSAGKSGAGEGARTLDPDLGKVVLYH
jgi:hypothetical protein